VKARTPLTNSSIAELLANEAEFAPAPLNKAFRRASRRSFLWPEEATDILKDGRSLTDLPGVGPYLEKVIRGWIENPPKLPGPPPEIRRGFFTLSSARELLARKPAWLRKPRGDLQMHTEWSDGSGSIAEMAEAAVRRGYEFIAITDHSKGLKIAGGIDEAELGKQALEIESVNETLRSHGDATRLLRSLELNLNPSGEGDMDESALAELDIVLGCFHSSLRRKEDQTERYLAALRNPSAQILGHPRGRIYNYRLGLTANWTRVFDLAATLDKAVEIDCYPDRQDLSQDLVVLARKAGCRISLGTDAHGPSQLAFIDFGLASAAQAGIPRERILNFMTVCELMEWVASVRQTASISAKRSGISINDTV
jgi:histidinol phosphatase-like PHP family hydrolase